MKNDRSNESKSFGAGLDLSKQILDNALEAVILMDQNGKICGWNTQAHMIFGWGYEEVVGENLAKTIIPVEYREAHLNGIKRFIETGHGPILNQRVEIKALNSKGHEFPIELSVIKITDGSNIIFCGFVRDLTKTKAVEEDMHKLRLHYEHILLSAGNGIYGIDSKGITTFVNPSAARMLKYEIEELISKPQHSLVHHSHPDGSPYSFEDCPIVATFRDGVIHHISDEVFWRKDGTCFPVEYVSTPIMENGKILGAVVTFNDITKRKRLENDLRSAIEASKLANDAKTTFLANTSHEIRTPLNAIIGFSNVLKGFFKKNYFGQKFEDYLDVIIKSGEVLTEVINNVLDLSKIESGKVEVTNSPFNLLISVKSLYSIYSKEAQNKNLVFQYHFDNNLNSVIYSDRVKLNQILTNLIGNAIKFTPKGRIDFHVYKDQNFIVFKLEDTGIGISEDKLKVIFNPFEQADSSTTREFGGSGLGLSIAKELVKVLNGEIWCESQKGKGSCFYCKIPYIKYKGPDNTQSFSKDIIFSKEESILLVEDNEENLILARELLSPLGVTLYIAKNGREAIEMADRFHPNIIFMDIQMPIMDGLEATRQIRKLPQICDTPIIGMSAHALHEHKMEALNAGQNDYLEKPLAFEKLVEVMKAYLNKSVGE